MAHRRSFRGGISQSQRRKKVWGAFEALASDDVLTGTEESVTLNFSRPSVISQPTGSSQSVGYVFGPSTDTQSIVFESTLLRIRGSLNMDKNDVATANVTHAFGIGVMEATAANLGAFPNPARPDGAEWDGWMFYRSINSAVVDAASTMIDVKAMRKIQSGYALIFVAGSHFATFDDGSGTTPAIATQLTARGLFLLP